MNVTERTIAIHLINDVTEFVHLNMKQKFNADLCSGRHVADAKSQLGIYSIDITKPTKLVIHADESDEDVQKYLESIDKWIIK